MCPINRVMWYVGVDLCNVSGEELKQSTNINQFLKNTNMEEERLC